MIRILVLEPDFSENGAIRISLDRASRWAATGAEVTMLFTSSESRESGVTVPAGVRTVVANRTQKSTRQMIPIAVLRGLLHAHRADVIVVGRELGSALLAGTLLAKLARKPLAITLQSNFEQSLQHYGTEGHKKRVLACYKQADLLVPVSRGLARKLSDIGIPHQKIAIVENDIDRKALLKRAGEAPAIPLPPLPFIMALGRLEHQKGFDILIEAHAKALQRGAPQHQLLIAGTGSAKSALAGLAEQLGVAESVVFAGFLANPFPVLKRATLFVLSSRWEGFPLVLAEALTLEVPVVSTDCVSGPSELLEDGRYGDLVPVEDEDALADAIVRHLNNPQRLKEKAQASAGAWGEDRDAQQAAEKHFELLKSLTALS